MLWITLKFLAGLAIGWGLAGWGLRSLRRRCRRRALARAAKVLGRSVSELEFYGDVL